MAKLRALLAAAFDFRPGEGLPLLVLLVHSFADGLALVFLDTPASTLFLGRFSVKSLPYVYILIAATSTLIGIVYSKLESKLSRVKLLAGTVVLVFLTTTGFYLALLWSSSRWLLMGLMIWKEVAWILSGIEFWVLAGLLFNVRQGKRLFALVGSGQVVSGVLGGLSIPLIDPLIGTEGLILIAAAGNLLSFAALICAALLFRSRLVAPRDEEEEAFQVHEKAALRMYWKQRYLVSFFGVSVLSCLAFYFMDYLFYDQVEAAFPDQTKLASFFGIYYAVLNGVEFASSTLASGRLMTRFGLGFGLFAVPLVNLSTTGAALFSQVILGAGALFLWTIVVGKLMDEVVRNSVQVHAFRILYQPLPAAKRLRIQALRESVVEPVAIGVSGIILLVLTSVLSLAPVALLYLVVVILVAWIFCGTILRREYTATLVSALSRKRRQDLNISLDDSSTVEVLRKGLLSDHPGQVLYSLQVLEENEHESFVPALVSLLAHRDPDVKRYALERIEALRVSRAGHAIIDRLKSEESPEVKAQCLRTLCAIGESEAFETVSLYLSDPNPGIRKGAMVGLLRSGGIDGVLSAGGDLNALLASSDPKDLALAASVLGEVGIRNFFRPLINLLNHENVQVRVAALAAAGKLRSRKLLPLVMDCVQDEGTSEEAMRALFEFGEVALPSIQSRLEDRSSPRPLRVRLARLCGQIGGKRGTSVLKRNLSEPDREVRGTVLQSLARCRFKAREADTPAVVGALREEVGTVAWVLASALEIGGQTPGGPILSALAHELTKAQDRVATLVSFLHGSDAVDQSLAQLRAGTVEQRASALELLDNILTQDVKGLVFPIFDELTPAARLARLHTEFPQERLSRGARLEQILTLPEDRASEWTKACALFEIGNRHVREAEGAVERALSHPSPIVRETAAWALYHVNEPRFRERSVNLRRDPSPMVRRTISRIDLGEAEGASAPVHVSPPREPRVPRWTCK